MAEERLGASFSIDITNLRAGLTQANRLIKESESEFKAAAAGLDKWNQSEAGVTAKIKSLTDVTEIQRKKVDALKSEYQRLIDNGLDPTSRQAVELRTKINNEEAALKKNEAELKRQTKALEELGDASEDTGDSIEDTSKKAEKSTGGFTVLKGALANLVADGFRMAISAAKDFAKEMITTAAEVKAANSQFSQAFGDLEDDANDIIGAIADKTGILETRLKSTGAGIYSFARSSGATTAEAMELMEESLMATADSAAYYDRSLEDSAETLQSFLKGNFANDAALGVSATEFTRNAKAAELFGKKYNDLSEIEKQKTLLKMVTDSQALSGAMGQAARESDGFENVMGNVSETWKQFQAKVGEPVLEQLIPIIKDVTSAFQEWADGVDWNKFGKTVAGKLKDIIKGAKELGQSALPMLKTAFKVVGTAIKFLSDNFETLSKVALVAVGVFATFKAVMAVSTAINAAKVAVAGLSAATSVATAVQTGFNAAMAANPIGAIATAIALLTVGIIALTSAEKKEVEVTDVLSETHRNAVTAIEEEAQAYRDAKAAAEEKGAADVANIDYTKNLVSELQTLVNENGEVKAGYEARANFILNELAAAYGDEYGNLQAIIDQNGQVKQSIYDVIEARKAEIMLQAYEESYREAVAQVGSAYQERAIHAQGLAEAEAEYKAAQDEVARAQEDVNKSIEAGGGTFQYYNSFLTEALEKEEARRKSLEEEQAAYDQAQANIDEYTTMISGYEDAQTAFINGQNDVAQSILNNLGTGFQTAASTAQMSAEEQQRILGQQVIDTEVNLKLMEEEYDKRSKNMTETEKTQAEERIKNARKQADDAKTEFQKVGGNITKGIAEGAESESWILNNAMENLIDDALEAARRRADSHSPSRLFRRKLGITLPQGIAVGIDDGTKDVIKSVRNQVAAIQDAYSLDGVANNVEVGAIARKSNSAAGSTGQTIAGGVVVNQYNTYSQAHSRYELYKSKQQTEAAVRLALGV